VNWVVVKTVVTGVVKVKISVTVIELVSMGVVNVKNSVSMTVN